MQTHDETARLLQLEDDRCKAMVAGDKARLRQLLHRDLIHVHAKGQVDNHDSYFASGGFKVDYTRVERSGLDVRVLGETALMTGRQILEAVRKATGEKVRIDSRVMQVWVREGGTWQEIAFQTTPIDPQVVASN